MPPVGPYLLNLLQLIPYLVTSCPSTPPPYSQEHTPRLVVPYALFLIWATFTKNPEFPIELDHRPARRSILCRLEHNQEWSHLASFPS